MPDGIDPLGTKDVQWGRKGRFEYHASLSSQPGVGQNPYKTVNVLEESISEVWKLTHHIWISVQNDSITGGIEGSKNGRSKMTGSYIANDVRHPGGIGDPVGGDIKTRLQTNYDERSRRLTNPISYLTKTKSIECDSGCDGLYVVVTAELRSVVGGDLPFRKKGFTFRPGKNFVWHNFFGVDFSVGQSVSIPLEVLPVNVSWGLKVQFPDELGYGPAGRRNTVKYFEAWKLCPDGKGGVDESLVESNYSKELGARRAPMDKGRRTWGLYPNGSSHLRALPTISGY